MAQRTVIIDDIDGTEGAVTREFGLFGDDYEIDLTDANAEKLRKALEKYTAAAHRVPKARRNIKVGTRSHTTLPTATSSSDLDAIRDWGRKNGYEVSDRGRIKKEVQDAFHEAHKPGANNAAFSGQE